MELTLDSCLDFLECATIMKVFRRSFTFSHQFLKSKHKKHKFDIRPMTNFGLQGAPLQYAGVFRKILKSLEKRKYLLFIIIVFRKIIL